MKEQHSTGNSNGPTLIQRHSQKSFDLQLVASLIIVPTDTVIISCHTLCDTTEGAILSVFCNCPVGQTIAGASRTPEFLL